MKPTEETVAVVTDSTCDIPPALIREMGITVVPLTVTVGGKSYLDGVDLSPEEFYRLLATHPDNVSTSQPSVGDFVQAYTRLCSSTKSIVSLHISSKLSGTFNAAAAARDAVMARCQVEVIDTQSASLGLGFPVLTAAEAARRGEGLKEVAAAVRRVIPHIHLTLFVDSLEYLQRGGRIGRAQAFLGSMLNVKPILKLEDGEFQPVERVRTRAKALERIYEFVELFPSIERIALLYTTTPEDAETLARRIEPLVPREKLLIAPLGAVTGAHVGPGIVAAVVDQGAQSPY